MLVWRAKIAKLPASNMVYQSNVSMMKPPGVIPFAERSPSQFAKRLVSFGLAMVMQQSLRSTRVRIAYYDSTVDPARAEYDEHCVFVFWHENLAVLLPQWPRCPVTLLVSQHRDAQWLNHAANFMGFNVVLGSSTRGGSQAIRRLKQLRDTTSFAITPDGPRGPRRAMATGPLFLASRLQMPLVPVGVGYDRPYRLRTWDRFAVPRPFSRARIVFGPKYRLDRDLGRDGLEHVRNEMEGVLNCLTDFAADWASSGARVLEEKPFIRARRCQSLRFDNSGRNADSSVGPAHQRAA
jgi:lysophospholipid acyltransferase (LPLAT)-like uncharacterized protein